MEIYLDFEKTLLNDKNEMSENTIQTLKYLAREHNITILTTATLAEVSEKLDIPNIRIVSTLENQYILNSTSIYEELDKEKLNQLLKSDAIYTAYTALNQTIVFHYKERLKSFYPNTYLKIENLLSFNPSFMVIAVKNEALSQTQEFLFPYHLEILAKDKNRTLLKITKTASTKESWLMKLKKSPALGIGDSLEDYSFIMHCEYQAAMQNADSDLKKLCKYHTSKSNNADGAVDFILSFLKHQQV